MERPFVHRVRFKPASAVSVSSNQVCQRWSFEGGTAPVIGAPYSATETIESATTYRDGNRTVRVITNRRIYTSRRRVPPGRFHRPGADRHYDQRPRRGEAIQSSTRTENLQRSAMAGRVC